LIDNRCTMAYYSLRFSYIFSTEATGVFIQHTAFTGLTENLLKMMDMKMTDRHNCRTWNSKTWNWRTN